MPLRFAIDDFGDHLHTCTHHAGATSGAHEHILTALQRLFTKAGYRTDRKHVPHSRGLMMIVLLLFLQKQSLAFAVYLFGIGTLLTGPGLKKAHVIMLSP